MNMIHAGLELLMDGYFCYGVWIFSVDMTNLFQVPSFFYNYGQVFFFLLALAFMICEQIIFSIFLRQLVWNEDNLAKTFSVFSSIQSHIEIMTKFIM